MLACSLLPSSLPNYATSQYGFLTGNMTVPEDCGTQFTAVPLLLLNEHRNLTFKTHVQLVNLNVGAMTARSPLTTTLAQAQIYI